ncbi:unnamed protein product [Prorocentrum cordatum]|uniref:Uncharacterized protein n=1 Tax=Prorocentrum cordatum TaxID=2364126 RepID=A0ABN9WTP9_9DINO|nr:unnamed protein product [Polarella glacialis]
MSGIVVARRALAAALLLRTGAAIKVVDDPEGRRDQGRPQTTAAPTGAPTPAPTPEPTPEPTYVKDLPGVPCQCNNPSCWARYDLNGDDCITQDECDLQVPLLGNCSSTTSSPATYGPPVWDQDGDGCINFTEWDIIYTTSNGACCPVEPPSYCDECPEGYTIAVNPCECVPCVGGEVRRRRSLECTPCPSPFIDKGDFDDCKDPVTPYPDNAPNNSLNITVAVPYQTCTEFSIGDTITISGTEGGDPNLPISHTTLVMGVDKITGGYELELADPLPGNFAYDATVRQTCSSTDGSQVSASFSPSSDGCCCACGSNPEDCCETTEVCTVYPNGTGVCSNAGPYPEFSTPAPTVGAKGDPHLVNLQGEHFDINHDGKFTLLRFPQAMEKPAEFTFVANIQPDAGKPCTTYITEAEVSGAWLGSKILQVRSYRKAHSNETADAFLGARLIVDDDEPDPPWQTIEEFDTTNLELSEFGVVQSFLEKATWFPKKRSKVGPTAAGMFTLSLKNMHSGTAAKITIRQDLPEQEHLNVAVRQLSQLGRVDVGGLLGFDAHPESLERPSAACVHHRATARYRIESQDDAEHGYYFRPTWKDRWDKVRGKDGPRDNEASASLIGARLGGGMCKCSSDDSNGGSIDGVLVEDASFVFAEASWE